MSKQTNPPSTLEDRIRSTLGNTNAGSQDLAEIIKEVERVEAEAVSAEASIRTEIDDLVRCPDPRAARERLVEVETQRSRLATARKPLRDALAKSLANEERDRWSADYRRIEKERDAAVEKFKKIPALMQEIADALALAEAIKKKVDRINGSAPDGIDRRMTHAELLARGLRSFTRDNPSLTTTMVLPDWTYSSRTIWPRRHGNSLAVAFAESMIVPPHPGPAWSTPEVQQQHRAEVLKSQRELGDHFSKMTAAQEAAQNAAEKEKLSAHRR